MTPNDDRPGEDTAEATEMANCEAGDHGVPEVCGVAAPIRSVPNSALSKYLDAVFGDGQGYVHVAIGVGGKFNENGRYDYNNWIPGCGQWPSEREKLIELAEKYSPHDDLYISPYLRDGESRRLDDSNAVDLRLIHSDYDNGREMPIDLDKVRGIGGFAVGSGSPGNAHVYVPLTEVLTHRQHQALCRALGVYLGKADSKITQNDVLRPAGTWNHKSAARGGDASPVVWLVEPDGTRVETTDLARLLGVDLDDAEQTAGKTKTEKPKAKPSENHHEESTPFDLDQYLAVKAVVEKSYADRSEGIYAITAAVKAAGLTLENAYWAVEQNSDAADGVEDRLGRGRDDVQKCWDKIDEFVGLTLPAEFWERPALKRIQEIAYAETASPDAVLGITLANVAAALPPSVRIDTGVRKTGMSANFFVAPAGRTGGFKSTADDVFKGSIRLTPSWHGHGDVRVLTPEGEDLVLRAYPGTGQGLVENFMGEVEVPDATDSKNKPKRVRRQVRTNVILESDEGNWLVKELADDNSKVGETIREMFSGKDTGQGNAKAENRRGLRQGEYSFGMVVGLQLVVLAKLIRLDIDLGTGQRILAFWSGAPGIPDDDVWHPGDLSVTIPAKSLYLEALLQAHVKRELKRQLRNGGCDDDAESQRIAVLIKTAALLAILDGQVNIDDRTGAMTTTARREISWADWELAKMISDTSRNIKDHALAQLRGKERAAKNTVRAMEAAHQTEIDELRKTPTGQAWLRIRGDLVGGGRVKWTGTDGIRNRFKGTAGRDIADKALVEFADHLKVTQEGRTTWVELVR